MSKRVTSFKMFVVTLPAAGAFKEKKARAYIDTTTGDVYGSEKIITRLKSKNDKAVESLTVVEDTAKRLFPDVTDIKLRGKIVREVKESGRMLDKESGRMSGSNGSGTKLTFLLM